MQVQIVSPAAMDTEQAIARPHFAASYLVNGCLAIDAGGVGWLPCLKQQQAIADVVISHPHLDHIASLPTLLENTYGTHRHGVTIWASETGESALRTHLFNDVVWPRLETLNQGEHQAAEFQRYIANTPFRIGALELTPLELDHGCPTFGFLVDDGQAACAFVSDTGPTETVWQTLDAAERLSAVFLECSFPNRMQWLADKSKHLTPRTFLGELQKLDREVPVYAIHLKAPFHDEICSELDAYGLATVSIGEVGKRYTIA